MNKNFINFLNGLRTPHRIDAMEQIFKRFETALASDNTFYSKPEVIKRVRDATVDMMNTADPYLEAAISVSAASPYNVFKYLLDEDYSDTMIYKGGVIQMDGKTPYRWSVPEELRSVFESCVKSMVRMVVYTAGKKFDVANSILDQELGTFRFNVIHESLPMSRFPVIVIRKQVIKASFHMSEEYTSSLGCSENQLDYIRKFAQKGNFIIFGETGSGKTTLLKYMASYGLESKGNLCIIEDTSELNIPVPISLLTNNHKSIKDLFTATLRENPSHVIIGETRTDEIIDILESALTISVGTTIHANSFARAIERIIFMSISRKIDTNQVLNLIAAAIDCFIFMENRRVAGVWIHKDGIFTNAFEAFEKVE